MSSLEKSIIQFLRHHSDAEIPLEMIAGALRLDKKKDAKKLRKTVNRLVHKQEIIRTKGGMLRVRHAGGKHDKELTGKLDMSRGGVGYVDVEEYEEDIRISPKRLHTALPDDTVTVEIIRDKRSRRIEGRITGIVKRGREFYVGTLIREAENYYYIQSDPQSAQTDFYVLPDHIGKASHNDKVTFELLSWDDPRSLPEARVLDVLGPKHSNDAMVLSILAENQIKGSFPPEVEDFADQIDTVIPDKEIARRLDLRDLKIITIDPVDAKDFDDALSIEMLSNGNYHLGVHIADVTHYLQPDTILDGEAYKRGTSVYLVDRVIPMLPEALSNGVCSLRPDEDKLAYSCFMEVDPDGTVVDYRIAETIINSKHRFTYEGAQKVIDGGKHAYSNQIKTLHNLGKMLTDRRYREGAIDFDTPEAIFELGENGFPVSVRVKERLDSHRLVEECMLLANKTIARHIDNIRRDTGKKKTKDLYPFLYRIHDKPDTQKLQAVAEHVRPVGIQFDIGKSRVTSQKVNQLLERVKDTPLEFIVNQLILRAMAKAEYSPKNIGHFGLNFSHYAHFTSPIRRYPDVIVHRLLKSYAAGKPSYRYDKLNEMGEHTSNRERMAIEAERDSIKLKQVEFMSRHIGDQFEGIISGVIEKGIFVDIKDMHAEGMVHISKLDDDYYIYDEKRHCLIGRSRGRKYQMGNVIRVRVIATNTESRNIDLGLAK